MYAFQFQMACKNNFRGASMFQIRNCLTKGVVAGALVSMAFLHAPVTQAATESVVHSFQGYSTDGGDPQAGLIDVGSKLYGTTYYGGANSAGTVFSVNPTTGAEAVVYSFCCDPTGPDGAGPQAGLIRVGGKLFGTTSYAGDGIDDGEGTVFSVNPTTGAETVVHSFWTQQNPTDGYDPEAALIDVGGKLYGTTYWGGANGGGGSGTVFSVNPTTGAETVVYSFCSQTNCTDGANPVAGLIDVGGKLYGTTYFGGSGTGCGGGCGTVFKIDPTTGMETVLHSFQGYPTDGEESRAGLIDVGGKLYGTTLGGGANDAGTVFKVNPTTGAESVVYSFQGSTAGDGAFPEAALIDVGGTLYGTTYAGGISTTCPVNAEVGCGTVFSLNPTTGAETVLYSFCSQGGGNCTDGEVPQAGLIDVGGTLYGTTSAGGANCDCGTVFKITP
jgi:uncharacterized repeat protein (TIGR03803 family)